MENCNAMKSFNKNDWVVSVADKSVNTMDQILIVFEVEDDTITVKQWKDQKEISVRKFKANELRRITFNEFIRVLSNRSNGMKVRI